MAGRVLVTGAGGMVGSELVRALGSRAVAFDREALDVTDAVAVREAVERVRPTAIVNAAAFTDVDAAESRRDDAFAVNAAGAGHVAAAAAESGAFCVHLSTDFVFDGRLGRPYREDDLPSPISAYSQSKAAGERLVLEAHPLAAVARTAWVYGAGHRTFLSQILDRARAGDQLRVVTDQTGSPTWVRDLVEGLVNLIDRPAAGIFHLAGGGECSRFQFARAIVEAAGLDGELVQPVRTDELPPRAAARSTYAPLQPAAWKAAGFAPLRHWREALSEAIKDFA